MNDALKSALISEDGLYRYWLTRIWGSGNVNLLPFVMLNPSIASAEIDDPTIRRCMGFAKRDGYDGIEVVNLYALRSTDPAKLWIADNPIGPENDKHIRALAAYARRVNVPVVCAWGVNAATGRAVNVMAMIAAEGAAMVCLGVTKYGHPRHPLMMRADQPFVDYSSLALYP